MTNAPSPAQVAARASALRARRDPNALEPVLRREFGGVVRTIEGLGLNVSRELGNWIQLRSVTAVSNWIHSETPVSELLRDWSSNRTYKDNLLAALVVETVVGRRLGDIGPYMRGMKSSVRELVISVRVSVAFALVESGYDIPFYRPVMLTRTLSLARQYLGALSGLTAHMHPELARKVQRELGKVLVHRARFDAPRLEDLRVAKEMLGALLGDEREKILSAALYLEACLSEYRIDGSRSAVQDAAATVAMLDDTVALDDWPAWHLNVAEVWLSLAELAVSQEGRSGFLRKARTALDRALANPPSDPAQEIRALMFDAILQTVESKYSKVSASFSIRGMRLPFGFRGAVDVLPDLFFEAAEGMIEALRPAASDRGVYAFREVLSELHSTLGVVEEDDDVAIGHLEEAIRLRGPVKGKNALEGVKANLGTATDLLGLAVRTRGQSQRPRPDRSRSLGSRADEYRSKAARVLLESFDRQGSPEYLMLLAKEIESHGSISVSVQSGSAELVNAVRRGSATSLYGQAATLAIESLDLQSRPLGGRSGSIALEDYAGLVGQTFVVKRAPELCVQREVDRTASMKAVLEARGLSSRFGLIEHVPISMADHVQEVANDEIVSVRRYVSGKTLREHLNESLSLGAEALRETVRYLALFHSEERCTPDLPRFGQEIRQNDLGKWLKRVVPPGERIEVLTAWKAIVADLPQLRRRDAHSLNWIVEDDGRILAVDLESHGTRPLGYELAQLTDDAPVFGPRDIESRLEILSVYSQSLAEFGNPEPIELISLGYFAGLAARAVCLVSDERSSEEYRWHGLQLLEVLAQDCEHLPVKTWCQLVLSHWRRLAGLLGPADGNNISDEQRRKISKAMSFHLRHNLSASKSREGWMAAEELSSILNSAGHRVTPGQLLLIGGAMGEPRFEIDGSEIRAMYGHSDRTAIKYEMRVPSKALYHGTEFEQLDGIFAARTGLKAMRRQFVHLQENLMAADLAGGRRTGSAVLLEFQLSPGEPLRFASNGTWLVESASVDRLRLVSVREMARR